MSDNSLAITARFNALIAQLQPAQRQQLAREIGRNLAMSQRQRIAAQQNPDGTAYEPRKPQKPRKGKIRQKVMFKKLRTARFMRTVNRASSVEIGYSGQNAYVASRHQFGREGVVNKNRNIRHQYAQRELLGFTEKDIEMVENLVIGHLAIGK